jgi:excisionase family DNA binding protein
MRAILHWLQIEISSCATTIRDAPVSPTELLDLNRESVYRALAKSELQAVRVGRSICLPRSQIADLLAEGSGS